MIECVRDRGAQAAVSVWGVGGAGGQAVVQLIANGANPLDILLLDHDARALQMAPAHARVRLALSGATPGAGTGGAAAVGSAARGSADLIAARLDGADLCILAAGLGGAAGSGAAPVIAATARARGIPTIAVVTTPMLMEGRARMAAAAAALAAVEAAADHVLVLPLQPGLDHPHNGRAFLAGLARAESVLAEAVATVVTGLVAGRQESRRDRADDKMARVLGEAAAQYGGELHARMGVTGFRRAPPAQKIAACYRTGLGPELTPVRRTAGG